MALNCLWMSLNIPWPVSTESFTLCTRLYQKNILASSHKYWDDMASSHSLAEKGFCATLAKRFAASAHKKFIWWQHCIRSHGLQPKTLHVHRLGSQGEIPRRTSWRQAQNTGNTSPRNKGNKNRAENKCPDHNTDQAGSGTIKSICVEIPASIVDHVSQKSS